MKDLVLDKEEFRKKYLIRLLSSPLTLFPFVLGITILIALWAFSMKIGVAIFAAIACILGAFGVFFTRLALGSETISNSVIEEMQETVARERERRLDELDRNLVEDGDGRTESCLRDLRALARAFQETPAGSGGLGPRYAFDIASGVEDLFNRSVVSLEQTLDLWRTAAKLGTPEAKRPVLDQREKIIEEVRRSIEQLGKVLAGVQSLKTGMEAGSDLARIREELDEQLSVAKRVGERMRSLEQQIEPNKMD
jgi:hypothetical protein